MADTAEWYLPDPHGGEASGPYTTEVLLEKIKQGALRLDDFAWGPHLPGNDWRRLHELSEFQALMARPPLGPVPRRRSRGSSAQRHVTLRLDREGEYGIENRYRRYPRAPLEGATAVLHDQERYVHARCADISEKGVSLELGIDAGDSASAFEKGEEVIVTVRGVPGMGAFSVSSVVLRAETRGETAKYGLYFLRLNPNLRHRIARYVLEALREAEPASA